MRAIILRAAAMLLLFLPGGFADQGAPEPLLPGFSVFKESRYKGEIPHFGYVNPQAPKGGMLRLAVVGYSDSLNPYNSKSKPAPGLNKTFATLMAKAEDEEATCYGYAASHVRFSEDGRSFTFYLRPQARFHDGTPITPQDVVATYGLLNHPSQPIFASLLATIKKVEQVGDRGIRFILNEGDAKETAFVIGTELFILSKKEIGTAILGDLKGPLLGSGPYKLVSYKPNFSQITYMRQPHWWGKDLPCNKGKFNFDTIIYTHYLSHQGAFEAFKAGQVDVRQELKSSVWYNSYDFPAVTQGRVKKLELPHPRTSGMLGFAFNVRQPNLADRRVRKALALMLDFEWLNKNLFHNSFVRLRSYFTGTDFESQGFPTAQEQAILKPYVQRLPGEVFTNTFAQDLAQNSKDSRQAKHQALALLAQAGWVHQDGRLVNEKTGRQMTLRILLPTPAYKRVVHAFQRSLEHLGIAVELMVPDRAHYQELIDQGQFDIAPGSWIPLFEVPFNKQELFWHSKNADIKGSKNIGGVKDPVVDDLLAQIRKETDVGKLKSLMRAFDRVLLHNYYMIPQWRSNAYWVAHWSNVDRPKALLYHGFGLDSWWHLDDN